ncbi:MAG: RNA 2'-phosphotransferase [Myxococcota bacterium]|nr:RNA 2'-phosphotransferase [Myxococcota bacterium]
MSNPTHSKTLAYLLRHKPQDAGLTLDAGGWVAVDVLVRALQSRDPSWSRQRVEAVVRESSKRRFALSSDGLRIRANQGHSIAVDLGLEPLQPPDVLFHGTVARFLPAIREQGLTRQARHHVHLSTDRETALDVGGRRGKPVLLRVDAAGMAEAGHCFFRSENGVWLTDAVPPGFLSEATGGE